MSRAEVISAVGADQVKSGRNKQTLYDLQTLSAYYQPDDDAVVFIEASHRDLVIYDGIDLFDEDAAAEAVIAEVARSAGLDPAAYPPDWSTYLFECLQLVLWRGSVPYEGQDDDDITGRTFESVSMYALGYYSDDRLRSMRSGSLVG